jgi:tetratricopeptide (TPR) repeat protein
MSTPNMSETTTAAPAPAPEGQPSKEILLKDLDPRLRRQVEAAEKAIDRQPGYTVEVCAGILTSFPGCLEVRKIMRKAQKRASAGKNKSMTRLLGFTRTPFMMKASSQLKKDPKGALEEAEKGLAQDPNNTQALRLAGTAATALGLKDTAVFYLEEVRAIEPENLENLMALGEAQLDANHPKEAVKTAEAMLEIMPGHGDAQALIRRAMVAITMDKGKWEDKGDFRQKLANAEEAASLEQSKRTVNDADTLTIMANQLKERIEKDPENMNLYRDLIAHLKQMQKFDDALEWIRKARAQPLGRADTTLEKLEADLTIALMRAKIEKLEEAVKTDPSLQPELDVEHKKALDFRLNQSKSLVEKYPNDYSFRYEYGSLLFEVGQMDLAIRELQVARRNPKVSHLAMLFLGRAYKTKRIYDLAEEQLEQAKKEMPLMNDLKKEIIYELGQIYNLHGKKEKAIDEFKTIYANDIDYRDVAQIINKYYEERATASS